MTTKPKRETKTCSTCGEPINIGARAWASGIVEAEGFDAETTLSWLDNRLIENRWTHGGTAQADPRFPDPRTGAPRTQPAIPTQTALRGVVANG